MHGLNVDHSSCGIIAVYSAKLRRAWAREIMSDLVDAQQRMRAAIQDIAVGPDRGRDISREHARDVLNAILAGQVDEVQAAIFLIALRMKRETLDEFLGLFDSLTANCASVTASIDDVLLLADPFDGYLRNVTMTPFIPMVLAALNVPSVIHGVETVGPKHGVTAHKVYKLAGADTQAMPESAAKILAEIGCAYVDQSNYAPDLFALQDLRHRMVKRSALTTLERLLVPIRGLKATRLALGYVHKAYPDIYARVAFAAGFNSALLFKGVEGGLAPALNKPLRRFVFEGELPTEVDAFKQVLDTPYSHQSRAAAMAMQPEEEAVEQVLNTGLSVLNGATGIARDSLCLAAGQIYQALMPTLSFNQAVEKVQICLDNGSALERFNAFIAAKSS